jgi:hypothetical protein
MNPSAMARKKRLSFRLHAMFPRERELMERLQQLRFRQVAPMLMQFILRAFEAQRRGEDLPSVSHNWPWMEPSGSAEFELEEPSMRIALGFQNPSAREAELLAAMQGLTDDRRADVLRSLALRGFAMEQMVETLLREGRGQSDWGNHQDFPVAPAATAPAIEPARTSWTVRPSVPMRTQPAAAPVARAPNDQKLKAQDKNTANSIPKKVHKSHARGEQVGDNGGHGFLQASTTEAGFQPSLKDKPAAAPVSPASPDPTGWASSEIAEVPESIPEAISGSGSVPETTQTAMTIEIVVLEPMGELKGSREEVMGLQALMGGIVGGPAGEPSGG